MHELNDKELDAVIGWAGVAFQQYADLCERRGMAWADIARHNAQIVFENQCFYSLDECEQMFYRGAVHAAVASQLRKCGEYFGRVLQGRVELPYNDDPDDALRLRNDLHKIRANGCPALALIELALACTSPHGITIPDMLLRADYLESMRTRLREEGTIPRPLSHRLKHNVSMLSRLMLEVQPYFSYFGVAGWKPDFRIAFHLTYLYALLNEFGFGYEDMREILRAMQHVRRHCPPVAGYLNGCDDSTHTAVSIRKRVKRFVDRYPALQNDLQTSISEYLSRRTDRSVGYRDSLLGIF
jgi:hypothetical protein